MRTKRRQSAEAGQRKPARFPLLILCSVVLVAALLPARAGIVPAGAGSYRTDRPKFCKPLPEKVYRTPDCQKPVITGQWWSSLLWQPYSQLLFPHPLAVRCLESGLGLSYPGRHLVANRVGIFGLGFGKQGDLRIGHSAVHKFPRADCGAYSDWLVTAVFSSGNASLRTSFGHGSPFVFCRITGGDPKVSFSHNPRVWWGASGNAVLGVTANGNHYGLFGPAGSTWSGLAGTTFVNHARGKDYFTIALLPDDRPETLALFRRYAHNHVTGTRAQFVVENGAVKTTYQFTIAPREGKPASAGTLFALYPHQWKYTSHKLTELTYGSVRGPMKLGKGMSFQTVVPVQGVLPFLPPQGIADRARVLGDLKTEADKKPSAFGDTYWEGKHLGKLATLSGVAEAAHAPEVQRGFLSELQRRLEAWFTARPGRDQPVFYYNTNWSTLIGSRPAYGSDDRLNDHHFHYGYFIRAAAEVARHDPAWARQWGPMVKLLIRDIASPDRRDPMFPYLHCFDQYAGHSWASGDANFADGNNQESSSEAMNAWYGLILWGAVTGDTAVRDTGVYLFNTERTAVEEYWFDVSGTNYPEGYPHLAAGILWGGKTAFETWFSPDIDCIHGINWLPFTPGSLYLGRHPDYVKKVHDRMVSNRKGGSNYNTGWGDLLCLFHALQDPASAAAYLDAHPQCKVESGNTRAFMHHWIHTLKHFGLVDASITASDPLALVFSRNAKRTYAAYNASSEPLRVTFSDGAQITARPRALTVQ